MSKKSTITKKSFAPAKIDAKVEMSKAPVMRSVPSGEVSGPVRNSAIPKAAPAKKEITYDQIARRAYEIYRSGTGGSESDNWHRAERELRGA